MDQQTRQEKKRLIRDQRDLKLELVDAQRELAASATERDKLVGSGLRETDYQIVNLDRQLRTEAAAVNELTFELKRTEAELAELEAEVARPAKVGLFDRLTGRGS